jgi:hypothetical protein
LITSTAILPVDGRSNRRLTVEYSEAHAASSIPVFSVAFRRKSDADRGLVDR